ncbi:LPS-assembly protein LptD [Paracoccus aminophilus]|uniref:LPS-assembly protein LptD n=1 Tax=Paracoccus aminophilus JCM 7686 TaxID=1367847 RepID=S5XRV2_PARAH|nr:LPS assembly protein LptD [Paracoccus aminophilus]AGT07842.1 organic solvent tolerance protein [Paracoccus aminophilus JCM 7686]
MSAARTGKAGRLGKTALLLSVLLPLPAFAQDDSPYYPPPPVQLGSSHGPALAPTETPSSDKRVGDGTDASSLPSVARAPRNHSITFGGPTNTQGDAATVLADNVALSGEKTLTASGGVVVWYKGTRLIASQVIYDSQNGTVTIAGPIHLTEPGKTGTDDETIVIADSAQLDRNMKDGILRGARLVLAREMQLAAREIRRTGEGRFTTMDRVVASSCQICAANPTPLWEIRARAITHDAEKHTLHFDQPQFRAFGIPVGALPSLTAPDPTVERMSGFLRPLIRTTSQLGFGMKFPYFVTLGDHADVTVTPYVSVSRTRTLELRYRQAFTNGAMEINGGITRDDIDPGTTRGYLFGAAQFSLPRGYRLGVQVQTATDRNYLLDYDITDADRLWSGVTLDRIQRDKLVYARIGNYESLRSDEIDSFTPSLVADAIWMRRWRPGGWIGGEAGLEWSLHGHRRSSKADAFGRDMARSSVNFDWRRSEILPYGFVGALQTEIDADLYHISQDSRYDNWFARIDPILAGELRWPLMRSAGAVTHILEPVLQVVWSPKRDWSRDVPNEDSYLIEFDEGNLFSLDRFPGWDQRESGLRVNAGMTWTRIDPAGWSIALTGGRVFRTDPDPAFYGSGPLGGKQSDWLLAAHYSSNDGLAIANRALFDDSFSISRNELRLGWLKPGLQLSAGYLWMNADPNEDRLRDVSELTATAGWQVRDGWWATTETRYDFTADRAQKAAFGLEYRNECVTMEMGLERRFTSSGDLKPETTFDLGIRLGGFGKQKEGRGTVARRACLR